MSKVFTFTPDFEYCVNADEIIKGGTGYGLENKLPAEIETIYPDYGLYPKFKEAYGFLTRGCPRNCGFCIVSKKEGLCSHIHQGNYKQKRTHKKARINKKYAKKYGYVRVNESEESI